MNRRLYFVLPDVDVARKVEDDLLLAKIGEEQMHFLGKRGTDLRDLPEAASQKTDLWHGIKVGLVSGALTGALIGLILYLGRDFIGMNIEPGLVLILFLVGAVFGVWVSGLLIGTSTPNIYLKDFNYDLKSGHILLMVDVPKNRVDEIRQLILSHHPDAEDHGIDPTKPAFP